MPPQKPLQPGEKSAEAQKDDGAVKPLWRRPYSRFARDLVLVLLGLSAILAFNSWSNGSLFPRHRMPQAATITRDQFTVIDGDTIKLDGDHVDTRLVGFNAPEVRKPNCSSEVALGEKARNRLVELLSTSTKLDFSKVACNCKPETIGTPSCNKGRFCGVLKVDGRDVGDILIQERLAARFICDGSTCPKTPRPWCDAPLQAKKI